MEISEQAINFVNAKERMKQREDDARNAAILRGINNDKIEELKLKLLASRITLLVAIAINFYAAAKGWGIL
jgi:hypothetical protein